MGVMIECFIGLGGNIGNTLEVMEQTLATIERMPGIQGLKRSRYYVTSALSDIPQRDYLNAAARFETTLPPLELFEALEKVEQKMGKANKPKNAPRVIDIDLLFYGKLRGQIGDLILPHPQWDKRLFVLSPLSDVVSEDFFMDLAAVIEKLSRNSKDKVELL